MRPCRAVKSSQEDSLTIDESLSGPTFSSGPSRPLLPPSPELPDCCFSWRREHGDSSQPGCFPFPPICTHVLLKSTCARAPAESLDMRWLGGVQSDIALDTLGGTFRTATATLTQLQCQPVGEDVLSPKT